jgi:mRNA-degrading endonuclease RelE of RelBE toxin-antitoxin system
VTLSTPYQPFYTRSFFDCLEKYRHLQDRVLILVERIVQNPKSRQSHLLKKERGIDLRGKRRRHLSGNFVVVYVVCDECIIKGFRAKRYNDCFGCEGKPLRRVIFLAFDKWDDIYSREWRGDLSIP